MGIIQINVLVVCKNTLQSTVFAIMGERTGVLLFHSQPQAEIYPQTKIVSQFAFTFKISKKPYKLRTSYALLQNYSEVKMLPSFTFEAVILLPLFPLL